jgi:hypothetical protein
VNFSPPQFPSCPLRISIGGLFEMAGQRLYPLWNHLTEAMRTEYLRSLNLDSRVRFRGGDFFKEPLPRTDVLIMGHILHDWDLEQKLTLLRKAYAALPEGGSLIVFEAMIDDDRSTNAVGLLMSLNMLLETPGGFDYTPADWQGWLASAGFRDMSVEALGPTESMVVARK